MLKQHHALLHLQKPLRIMQSGYSLVSHPTSFTGSIHPLKDSWGWQQKVSFFLVVSLSMVLGVKSTVCPLSPLVLIVKALIPGPLRCSVFVRQVSEGVDTAPQGVICHRFQK